MHTPLFETALPQFTSPFLAGPLSYSPPRHMQLGFVNLASHPHAQLHKLNAVHRTTISRPPHTTSSPSPQSAGSSHGHVIIPSHTTTSTSSVDTNAHAMGRGNSNGKATSPQNLSDGPGPSNGPARAGVRSPMYSHGSTGRVHPSLLTQSVDEPNEPLAWIQTGLLITSRSCAGAKTTTITATTTTANITTTAGAAAAAARSAIWKSPATPAPAAAAAAAASPT